jgi:hypothetical protein
LFIAILFSIFSLNDGSDYDGLGNLYLVLWRAKLTNADEPRIRQCCLILQIVNLHFDSEHTGVVIRADENVLCQNLIYSQVHKSFAINGL